MKLHGIFPSVRGWVFGVLAAGAIGALAGSCSSGNARHSADAADSTDLLARREALVRTIDSLSRELRRIEEALALAESDRLPVVAAVAVEPGRFVEYVEVQGNVKTRGDVPIAAEAGGTVLKIFRREGDRVRRGEVLFTLDDEALRKQLAEVRTQYRLARTTYERQRRLRDEGVGIEIEFLRAKAQKEALAHRLAALRAQLKKMTVRAPISGVIDRLDVKVGQVIPPLQPVGRVINLSDVYLEADLPERYLTQVAVGDSVEVAFPVLDTALAGVVRHVGRFIHPTNRTFTVQVDLTAPPGMVRPNMTGVLRIRTFSTDSALTVPPEVVQETTDGRAFVFVLEPTPTEGVYKVAQRFVERGRTNARQVMITSGLAPGDLVAAMAVRGLSPGMLVRLEPLP